LRGFPWLLLRLQPPVRGPPLLEFPFSEATALKPSS
jgi:hypothetical protein